MNIGVHFFDMLLWIFGSLDRYIVTERDEHVMRGRLVLDRADVDWLLSTSMDHVPAALQAEGQRVYRALSMGDDSFDFSTGFDNLHTRSYQEIISGNGFTITDARSSIELVYKLRTCSLGVEHTISRT